MCDQANKALGQVRVLFEDNHLLVVDKPAGLLTQPAAKGDDSLLDRAREYVRIRYDKPGNVYMGLVHRLDRNVSGLVVLAKTSKAASRLSRDFGRRAVDKRYLAVVVGLPQVEATLIDRLGPRPAARGVQRDPEGKEARLRYRRGAVAASHAWVEVELLTGRKHQIRAQLAFAGVPILGDPLYGRALRSLRRPALHAHAISFEHPVGKGPMSLTSPLPKAIAQAALSVGLPNQWQQF